MDEIKQDRRYKILPFGVPTRIRGLGINKLLPKKKRISGKDRISGKNRLTMESDLIKISSLKTFTSIFHSYKLNLSLINVQSIKPKENIILYFLLSNEIDLTLATETWLSNSDDDQVWVNSSTKNMGEYRIQVINRPDRRGGVLALIAKATIKTKLLDRGQTRSFAYGVSEIKCKNAVTIVTGMYHPPYPVHNPVTNSMFTDDITNFMSDKQ